MKSKPTVPKDITSRVGKEILRKDFEPSVWARALATTKEGDQDAIVAEYARLRISQLVRSRTTAKRKTDSHEERRLNACLGVTTVKDMLHGVGKIGEESVPRPKAPWLWMLLLVLGIAGCVSVAIRMLIGEVPDGLRLLLPVLSLGAGVGAVLAMILTSQFFSRALVAWFWGPGVVGLASAFCLGSLLLGTKLMMANPYQAVHQEASLEAVQSAAVEGKETAGVIRRVSMSAGIAATD